MNNRLLGNALRGIGRGNGSGSGRSSMEDLPSNQSQNRIQERLAFNDNGGEGPDYRRRRERSGDGGHHHSHHRRGPHDRMDRETDRKRMIYEVIVSLPRWAEVTNLPHLLQWLCHKAKDVRVEIVQATPDAATGNLIIRVKTAKESNALARLNGYTYNGQVLTISTRDQQASGSTPPPIPREFERPEVVQLLQQFINARFSAELRMLNLSAVEKEPLLYRTLGRMTTGSWTAMIKAASELCPMVETISFDDNQLRTLIPLNGLSHYLRNVINLSFANNLISNSASFKAALGGLSNLREVVLQGNPIREEAMGRNRESVYRKEIADMFPSLQFLDTKPVVERSPGAAGITQTSEQVKFGQLSAGAVEQKSKEPTVFPMRPVGKFFDSEETRQTVMGFLAKYMHLFDTTDRSTLLDVYSPVAVFSLTLFALNPVGVRAVSRQSASRSGSNGRQQRPAQHLDEDFDVSDIDFSLMKTARGRSSEWTNYDRNLHRVKDPLQRRKLSFKIPLDIAHTLAHLPKTIHKNPDTFVIDAWQIAGSGGSVGSNPIPPRLIMSVHGEFVEVPASPGSKSSASGWPVEIINDCLTIRPQVTEDVMRRINSKNRLNMPDVKNLSQLSEMSALPPVIGKQIVLAQPLSAQQQQQPMISLTPNIASSNGQLSLQQQQFAVELAKITGLNMEFSLICLKEHGWDPSRALEGFKAAKMQGRIPPQAFS